MIDRSYGPQEAWLDMERGGDTPVVPVKIINLLARGVRVDAGSLGTGVVDYNRCYASKEDYAKEKNIIVE